MEQRFRELVSRLVFLGYSPCERRSIIHESVGTFSFQELSRVQRTRAIKNMEKYAQLGSAFLQSHSK